MRFKDQPAERGEVTRIAPAVAYDGAAPRR